MVNASSVNDGGAALIVASEKIAKNQKLTPFVRIVEMATAGFDLRILYYGPVAATIKLLNLTGVLLDEI